MNSVFFLDWFNCECYCSVVNEEILEAKKNWRFNNAGSIVSNNIIFKNNDLDVQINETGKFYYNLNNSHNISILIFFRSLIISFQNICFRSSEKIKVFRF